MAREAQGFSSENPTNETSNNDIITVAYMNIRGQTGLDLAKQVQIENFLKTYKVDILNCQEININEDTFSHNSFISSSYDIVSNNATNKYGTCCIVSNNFNILPVTSFPD